MTDLNMHKTALKYGLILSALLMNFKAIDYFLFAYKISLNMYLGIIVFSFLLIGTWMGLHFHSETHGNSKMATGAQLQDDVSTDEE